MNVISRQFQFVLSESDSPKGSSDAKVIQQYTGPTTILIQCSEGSIKVYTSKMRPAISRRSPAAPKILD